MVLGLILSIFGIVVGVFASAWAIPKLGTLLGIEPALRNPAMILPLLLGLGELLGFFVEPLGNVISRKMESAADRFAIESTHDPASAKSVETKLTQDNLDDPNPSRLGYFLFASHPDPITRIQMAEQRR